MYFKRENCEKKDFAWNRIFIPISCKTAKEYNFTLCFKISNHTFVIRFSARRKQIIFLIRIYFQFSILILYFTTTNNNQLFYSTYYKIVIILFYYLKNLSLRDKNIYFVFLDSEIFVYCYKNIIFLSSFSRLVLSSTNSN